MRIRRTLAGLIAPATPEETTSLAISAEEKRLKGRFLVAGGSQAAAVTSAARSEVNGFGRPERLRSASPAIPSRTKRLRHFDTMFTGMSSYEAMVAFSSPAGTTRTIWARTTTRRSALWQRTSHSSS